MKNKNITVFYRVFNVLLCISLIGAGLCLIYGCLSIYFSADHTYTTQIVKDTFNKIAIPVYISVILSILSILLNIFIPENVKKEKNKLSSKNRLQILLSKKDLDSTENNLIDSINKERKKRLLIKITNIGMITLSSVVFLIYALNGSNFHTSEINSSMIKAMWVLLPCLTVMFLSSLITEFLSEKSIIREIEIVSALPSVKTEKPQETETIKSDRTIVIIRSAILIAGLGILIYGFATGGVADVLTKAVNICTECIGLG